MILKKFPLVFCVFGFGAIIAFGLIKPPLFSEKDSYPRLWKRVDSCENKGLTENALKIVLEIYRKAKAENNAPQLVKAIIHKMKFAEYKEEFSQEKNINDLKQEINTSKMPVRPVLESMLADAFWQYYQNNRWKFYNRTKTVNFNNEDVATYDLKTLVSSCSYYYNLSIKDTTVLKAIQVNVFDEIIVKGNNLTRQWRPTLYDFLAHRALDFYKSSEADVSKAANEFDLNEAAYLKPASDFLNYSLPKPEDTLDFKYNAVKIYRDLLAFHGKDKNENAVIDLELDRLDFMNSFSKNPGKDSLYVNSLRSLSALYASNGRASEFIIKEAEQLVEKTENYKPLINENYKWNNKKAYELCEGILKKYKGSRGAAIAQNLMNTIKTKSFDIISEEVNEVNAPNRVLVKYKNLDKIFIRLVKINSTYLRQLTNRLYGKELYSRLLKLPALQTIEQNLPDDKDFNLHSVEIKIPALDLGSYALLSSASPDFSTEENLLNYLEYRVSDIAYISKAGTNGETEFYVLNRQSGRPMPGVKARQIFNNYDYRKQAYETSYGKTFVTDAGGYFKTDAGDNQGRSFLMEFVSGKDTLSGNDNFYSYKHYPQNEKVMHSFLFTDRAIYRPGQTIYFKSIVFKRESNNLEIARSQNLTVVFTDVNGEKIASQELVTNDYGTVAGSFVAPIGVLTGQMQITDGFGTVYVSVEEYKRPKFETVFDTLKGQYKLNDEVLFKGIAKAFAGNPLDGADVKYRVTRIVGCRPYRCYWDGPNYAGSEDVEITSGVTKTNDKGEYEIKFKALPDLSVDKKEFPFYSFRIFADVTDINGETHSANTDVNLGYQSIELSFLSPETINTKVLPKMTISAKNLNGLAEVVNGTLTVYELKQPEKVFRNRLWEQPDKHVYSKEDFYKLFPHDLYEDETNEHKWEKLRLAFKRNFNTGVDKDITINEFGNLKPGVYLLEGLCKDKNGVDVKSVNYVTVFDPASNTMPYTTPMWRHEIKSVAEPGEKASFIAASSYKDLYFIYEIQSAKGISTSTISPSLKQVEVLIEEADRGGVVAYISFVKFGRVYSGEIRVEVPFSNKQLDIEYSSYRNKLLPGQNEEWKLTIKNKKGEKAVAEMLATLYDASLDELKANNWYFSLYAPFYPKTHWTHSVAQQKYSSPFYTINNKVQNIEAIEYDRLNYFEERIIRGRSMKYKVSPAMTMETAGIRGVAASYADNDGGIKKMKNKEAMLFDSLAEDVGNNGENKSAGKKGNKPQNIQVRKNFNETAFFYPQLQTNENGEVVIKFTMPESLTRWKFMGLAHTKDLSSALTQNECVTQKELMITTNAPRFLREGDKLNFVSKITNLSGKELSGEAELKFYDPFNEKDITNEVLVSEDIKKFTLKKGLSEGLEWSLQIPQKFSIIKYKIIAKAGNYSDGEEMPIPVLSNRILVTESMPLNIKEGETRDFTFTRFINQNNNSATLQNHAFTFEFTSNPAWYALQSLPYLMEYPYECAEQTFARYYSNALASFVVNSKPKIKEVFESWKSQSPDAFLSNLEKNQELKALLLEETPWVMSSKNEGENKKRLALLFDLNKMNSELNAALNKLEKMQTENGGWPWFSGCPEDWYISQHIVTGLGHLQKLGVISEQNNTKVYTMIRKGIAFCDSKLEEHFQNVKRYNKNYAKVNSLSPMALQYLYMRSFFSGLNVPYKSKTAVDFFKKQAQVYWLKNSRYLQAMAALTLSRMGDKKTPASILLSLKQNAIVNNEMGMYWKENYGSYYWYQAPIEMQAMMIEAFDEVSGDVKLVDALKTWLIKSKQTQNWGTTKATTEAVYALLLRGSDWIDAEANAEVQLGTVKLDPKNNPQIKTEAGTGYFRKTFSGNEINTSLGNIKLTKTNKGSGWVSVYWQYFEQLDKITPHESPLRLSKKLFVEVRDKNGVLMTPVATESKLKVGDKVKVRIELRCDRDLEYVHLKDMRAAGFEPVNVISMYRYQDGLGYYESTRDASTNFFISYLPKGTYVFEYSVFVNQAGNFSNGISSIQCMYAPEFTSHSEGIRIEVGKR